MKQESKIKRIFQAFTEESDLDEKTVEIRRAICESCPFNSKNAKDEDMSLLQRQKKVMGDFCLKCGCFINKKTARASEACGMEDVGLKPFWNRVMLKTTGETDLDIMNLTPENTNLKLSDMKDCYELDLYSFKEITAPLVIKIVSNVKDVRLTAYCDCIKVEDLGNNEFSLTIDTSELTKDKNIIKTIEVRYKKEQKPFMTKILIKGKYEL